MLHRSRISTKLGKMLSSYGPDISRWERLRPWPEVIDAYVEQCVPPGQELTEEWREELLLPWVEVDHLGVLYLPPGPTQDETSGSFTFWIKEMPEHPELVGLAVDMVLDRWQRSTVTDITFDEGIGPVSIAGIWLPGGSTYGRDYRWVTRFITAGYLEDAAHFVRKLIGDGSFAERERERLFGLYGVMDPALVRMGFPRFPLVQ